MLVVVTLGALLAGSTWTHRPPPMHQPRFLHEYTLPLGAYPSTIVSGPDGALWFSTYPYFTNHPPIDLGIGRITTSGKYSFFLIGNGTYELTVGLDGKLWFTNPYTTPNTVGSLTTSGTVVQYSVPSNGSPESIASDAGGNLWYTAFGANPDIIRIDTSGKTVATYSTPNASAAKVGPGRRDSMWFDEAGNRSLVGRVNTQGVMHEHKIGGPAYIPGAMAFGPDDRMWIADCTYAAAATPSFVVTLYPLPNSNSCIDGITAGPDGNMWATDAERGEIVRIAPTGAMTEYPVPTPSMIPFGITVGPDGNIWYGEIQHQTDISKIGVLAP
jgi:virginiamycin B lyase